MDKQKKIEVLLALIERLNVTLKIESDGRLNQAYSTENVIIEATKQMLLLTAPEG